MHAHVMSDDIKDISLSVTEDVETYDTGDDSSTDEGEGGEDTTIEDVDKEEDEYAEDLEEIKVKKAPKSPKEILAFKDRAIQKQKAEVAALKAQLASYQKEAPAEDGDDDTSPDIESLVEKTIAKREARRLIASIAKSPSHAALLKHHLDHTIRSSGDPETDVRNAQALIEAKRLSKLRQQKEEFDQSRSSAERHAPSGERINNSNPLRGLTKREIAELSKTPGALELWKKRNPYGRK